ncbi:hypothetical protein MSTO_00720 [Mycobacterium stomatepiae]|uniref:GTP pyrophosphokinase n=1 Tax=Mycobacterium stomatepiae TaxID=470076 RepID=A0A7I7Q1K4_9MYCO|nr:hypothetical protein MSTO_00720 [Mycobacterium stomatepiae]
MDPIAVADAIAAEAHAGQVDKAGMPYVGHVRRVASYVDPANTDAVVAALLHDVIEDTAIDAAELAERGIPAQAIDAIELLTRRDDQPSATYYQRISEHPTARGPGRQHRSRSPGHAARVRPGPPHPEVCGRLRGTRCRLRRRCPPQSACGTIAFSNRRNG